MKDGVMASKKWIILLLLIAAVAGTIAIMKRADTQMRGDMELVGLGDPLSAQEMGFLAANAATISHVTDLRTEIQLPQMLMKVNMRIVDDLYPLTGAWEMRRISGSSVFEADEAKRRYGMAVNKLFMEKSGLSLGDSFVQEGVEYFISGIIVTMPDRSGASIMREPLAVLRDTAPADAFYRRATDRVQRYRLKGLRKEQEEALGKQLRERYSKNNYQLAPWQEAD